LSLTGGMLRRRSMEGIPGGGKGGSFLPGAGKKSLTRALETKKARKRGRRRTFRSQGRIRKEEKDAEDDRGCSSGKKKKGRGSKKRGGRNSIGGIAKDRCKVRIGGKSIENVNIVFGRGWPKNQGSPGEPASGKP